MWLLSFTSWSSFVFTILYQLIFIYFYYIIFYMMGTWNNSHVNVLKSNDLCAFKVGRKMIKGKRWLSHTYKSTTFRNIEPMSKTVTCQVPKVA